MTAALLPPRQGRAEAMLADLARDLDAIPAPLPELWDPARCPAALLPWLAWALDVEDWDESWPEETRRRVVAEAIPIHRARGTLAGVRRALAACGLGQATIYERFGAQAHDGTLARDGTSDRAPADHWAEYRVILDRPVSIAQAEQARAIIRRAAPARSHLKVLDFREAPNLHDATVPRDGTFSRGLA